MRTRPFTRKYPLTAEELRVIRAVKNMTQQRLADIISVDRSLIAKIEAGSRSISPEIRRRLEMALGWNDPALQEVIRSVQAWKDASNG
ncbi:helix-turn-helix domain-containing protein [Cohnella lupini]|uniref:Helix-turn-helix protein n=1 Tax=Cohnella lupini TaxID=1294267 RepID=A0A3D9HNP9_9BACL|nr:helix-turn-helix transcriptional regulator [Cohnella lupini]RED51130.1 helix-turn-helix protein [Cohnella lupini]